MFICANFILISGIFSLRQTINEQTVKKYSLPKRPSHTRLTPHHDDDRPSQNPLKPPYVDNRMYTSKPRHQSLIILTYMRSGSSLLGDIVQHGPGAFYLYEPLHSLGRVYTHFQTNLTFLNGTVRYSSTLTSDTPKGRRVYLVAFEREIITECHPSFARTKCICTVTI